MILVNPLSNVISFGEKCFNFKLNCISLNRCRKIFHKTKIIRYRFLLREYIINITFIYFFPNIFSLFEDILNSQSFINEIFEVIIRKTHNQEQKLSNHQEVQNLPHKP